ncbi:hypothetical protein K491DRAFT_687600 [Lophiostoma macrostomum CBS 122681]|uniref:Brl1/Brr6 domain-containing protein n=1 Tax=Lophiostoma macrostomum CBS 122681 TaxID=1314788 RepID=A0A6A6TP69_9PLEO|nr:hypothetical protein K491DRAFT_687600 [Lophiostoma macrostomum CBS 122681]
MSRHHRDSTMPMDFEFDNGHGPVEANSPFMALKKRTHSALDSPGKGVMGGYNTPNRMHLGQPNSTPYYFNDASHKPLPAVPPHMNKSVWEPRTPPGAIDFADSSGGETPNTPGQDSDAATPDTNMASRMGQLTTERSKRSSPKKSPRKSIAKSLSGFFSSSPSPAKEDRRSYNRKAGQRIEKRRAKNRQLAVREEEEDSENEQAVGANANANTKTPPAPGQAGYVTQAGHFFSWLEAHPHLPSVLSFWFQLLVNTCLGLAFLYGLYHVWSSVMADVDIESKKYETDIMVEIAFCAKQYKENQCHPSTRVPALEQACGNWESCMQRDSKKVARASVTAKTFAMIFNAFVEEFSYKSMAFTAIIIFGGFNLSNWAFGVLRGKSEQHQHQHQNQQHQDFYPPPPATPQRHPSGGFIDHNGFYTPYQSMQVGMTPYGTVNQQASQSMPALALPALEGGNAVGAGAQEEREREREKEKGRKEGRGTTTRKRLFA